MTLCFVPFPLDPISQRNRGQTSKLPDNWPEPAELLFLRTCTCVSRKDALGNEIKDELEAVLANQFWDYRSVKARMSQ